MRAEDRLDRPLSLARKVMLASEVLVLYGRAQWLLRRSTLPAALAAVRRGGLGGAAPVRHPGLPYRLAWAVERVLGRLPADPRCLVRSVVLVGLLARRSLDASLVIGVRPGSDFLAHAWVEHDGEALLPSGGGRFERLAEL